ncbi:MAG: carboxylesterase family protein, partial [Caldimonas sp.]
ELGRQVVRDVVFTTFAKRIAWLHAERAPTWRYFFDYVAEGRRHSQPGAGHGAEIPFTMGNAGTCGCLGAPATAADREAAMRMVDHWSAFAAEGAPEAAGRPPWPRDGRQRSRVMVFGADDAVATTDFMKARLDAFTLALKVLDRVGPAR